MLARVASPLTRVVGCRTYTLASPGDAQRLEMYAASARAELHGVAIAQKMIYHTRGLWREEARISCLR